MCAELTQTSEILRIRAVLDGGEAGTDSAGAMHAQPQTRRSAPTVGEPLKNCALFAMHLLRYGHNMLGIYYCTDDGTELLIT